MNKYVGVDLWQHSAAFFVRNLCDDVNTHRTRATKHPHYWYERRQSSASLGRFRHIALIRRQHAVTTIRLSSSSGRRLVSGPGVTSACFGPRSTCVTALTCCTCVQNKATVSKPVIHLDLSHVAPLPLLMHTLSKQVPSGITVGSICPVSYFTWMTTKQDLKE